MEPYRIPNADNFAFPSRRLSSFNRRQHGPSGPWALQVNVRKHVENDATALGGKPSEY
jgi:hypothetical protein